jgi:hypothetical protein
MGNSVLGLVFFVSQNFHTFEEAVDLLTIEEEKLPRKTKLYTLIKSYSNTKLV